MRRADDLPPRQGGAGRARGRLALAFATLLGVVGLSDLLGLGASRAQTPGTPGWVALRVLALDATRGPIDVWLDGARILAAAPSGEPTAYVLVPAGAHRIAFTAALEGDADPDAEGAGEAGGTDDAAANGADPDAGATDTERTSYATGDLAPGSYVTLLLRVDRATDDAEGAGDAAAGEEDDTSAAPFVLLDDPLGTLPPAGRAGLRLVHAAPDAGRVALVSRDPDLRYDAPPLFGSSDDAASGHVARLAPLEASGYAMLTEGDKALWLVGEEGDAVLAEPLEMPLRAGTLYTLYLVAGDDGTTQSRLTVDATAPAPPGRKD